MQQLARRHSQKIIDENQKLRSELETKMNELDVRSKQLDELAAKSGYDRRNLEQEKQKVSDFSTFSSYPLFNEWKELIF